MTMHTIRLTSWQPLRQVLLQPLLLECYNCMQTVTTGHDVKLHPFWTTRLFTSRSTESALFRFKQIAIVAVQQQQVPPTYPIHPAIIQTLQSFEQYYKDFEVHSSMPLGLLSAARRRMPASTAHAKVHGQTL